MRPLRQLMISVAVSVSFIVILGFGWSDHAKATAIPEQYKTAQEKGRWIAEEVVRRDEGWEDSQVSLKMVLKNANGDVSERELRLLALEVPDDGDKSLSIFDSPADIKGTAFLTFSHINVADEQWIYLPALRRVKRITSKNKSGPFMGSTFAFEDLSSFEADKFEYYYRGIETLEGEQVYVSDLKPVYKYSGYSRQVVYIDTEAFRVKKVVYYDRKQSLLKTQTFSDYRLYLDKFWRAQQTQMVNHQTLKSTQLLWRDYQFKVGLNETNFNKNALKRIR